MSALEVLPLLRVKPQIPVTGVTQPSSPVSNVLVSLTLPELATRAAAVGARVGFGDGASVGFGDGAFVGLGDGASVGLGDGASVGFGDGASVEGGGGTQNPE